MADVVIFIVTGTVIGWLQGWDRQCYAKQSLLQLYAEFTVRYENKAEI